MTVEPVDPSLLEISGTKYLDGLEGPERSVGEPEDRAYTRLVASSVEVEAVSFLWEPYLPLGSVSLLVGTPGRGKTVLAGELAARISMGQLAGDLRGTPRNVLYLSAEDSPAHTLVPRLRAAGADLDRVSFLTIRRDGFDEGLTLPDDLPVLRAAMVDNEVALVVLDPVVAHLSGKVDAHRDHDIRRVLAPLARLADECSATILAIAHLNKAEGSDVFRRVGGSIGLTAAVRSLLILADDPENPDDETARVLIHAKSNLSRPGAALALGIEGRDTDGISTAGLAWRGESTVDIEDALHRPENRSRPKVEAAEGLLRDELAGGPVEAAVIRLAADGEGISWSSVKRAKSDLGVESHPVTDEESGKVLGWRWTLPATRGSGTRGPAPTHTPAGPLVSESETAGQSPTRDSGNVQGTRSPGSKAEVVPWPASPPDEPVAGDDSPVEAAPMKLTGCPEPSEQPARTTGPRPENDPPADDDDDYDGPLSQPPDEPLPVTEDLGAWTSDDYSTEGSS